MQHTTQPVIRIRDLSHRYSSKEIYRDLNLDIEPGTTFGLLGKNGVGKSTLINILMGYLKPQQGECLLFGEHANQLSPSARARIALLFEGFISYDNMNVEQIERFFSPYYPRWQKRYFTDLIKLMDISLKQPLSSLSFGQKSQVILGLLLAQDAELMILDDYSMGLDAGYRRLFVDYLSDYLNGTKKTVLITTHVMSDLEGLVNDIAIVDRSTEVYQSSMEAFTKHFRCFTTATQLNATESQQLSQHPLLHRVEHYRGQSHLYSFASLDELQPLTRLALTEQPLSFEDRFLGYVGKY